MICNRVVGFLVCLFLLLLVASGLAHLLESSGATLQTAFFPCFSFFPRDQLHFGLSCGLTLTSVRGHRRSDFVIGVPSGHLIVRVLFELINFATELGPI